MLNKLQKAKLQKSEQGFTIIEVMIVLAIAGLILLIVFLAIPALQRNGRNTTKRSDVSKTAGAVGEFASNNNGQVPATADVGALQTSANLSNGTTITTTIYTTVAGITAPTVSEVEVVTGVACRTGAAHVTATTPAATDYQSEVTAASNRSYAVIYNVEAAGGRLTTQCSGS